MLILKCKLIGEKKSKREQKNQFLFNLHRAEENLERKNMCGMDEKK